PSGQRCVSSASRPSGVGNFSAGASTSQLQQPLLGERAEQLRHVGENELARRREGLREVVDDRRDGRLAATALEDFRRDRVGLERALGREQYEAALRFVVHEAHAARQPRPRLLTNDGDLLDLAHAFWSSGTKAPGGTCLGAT